ncbi:MAG: dTMP kinase [Planctomycetia bacterium]|nr:dTMP kinase [Planctomycetia bacterium]
MFIALEGGDGAGKSTQLPLLQEWFEKQGKTVTICREPGSTPLGEKVRDLLLFQRGLEICRMSELLLFMTARAQVVRQVIRPALERDEVVLADRFLLSSIVYQGYGGELEVEEIRKIGQIATGGTLPELNIILDLPLTYAKMRRKGEPDRLESEADAFHDRVRNGFLTEARLFPEKNVVVSAEDSVERIHAEICRAIQERL